MVSICFHITDARTEVKPTIYCYRQKRFSRGPEYPQMDTLLLVVYTFTDNNALSSTATKDHEKTVLLD